MCGYDPDVDTLRRAPEWSRKARRKNADLVRRGERLEEAVLARLAAAPGVARCLAGEYEHSHVGKFSCGLGPRPLAYGIDRKHVVALTAFLPWPLRSGGQVRQFHLLEEARQRYALSLLVEGSGAGTDDERAQLSELWPEVRLATVRESPPGTGGTDLAVPGWRRTVRAVRPRIDPMRSEIRAHRDPGIVRALAQEMATADLLQVEFTQMYRYVPAHREIPVLMVAHDVMSRRDAAAVRLANVETDAPLLGRRARWHERIALRGADWVVVTSDEDAHACRSIGVKRLRMVPNGADEAWLDIPAGGEGTRLLFVAWGGHLPNQDGLAWWAREVGPLLAAGEILEVAGDGWTRKYQGTRMLGFVKDLRPLMRDAIIVAPLRMGAGTRLKLLEAMAAGRPIVATAAAAEGLPLVDGASALLLNRPEELVDGIRRLRADAPLRARLGLAAREAAVPLLWPAVRRRMAAVYGEILGG